MEETKQILIAITELQTNMRNMSAKIDEISKISTMVSETDQRAKSAHIRIDDLKTEFADKLKAQKDDYEEKITDQKDNLKELKSHITWLWRAIGVGAIGFVFWLLQFFINNLGGK